MEKKENLFDKWDKNIDTEGLAKDVEEAAKNGGANFKEVPAGEYEVAVHQLELKASQKGDPMVSIWFKVVSEGEYKGSLIFMNQLVVQGFQIHIVNELLRDMVANMDKPLNIEFVNYKQYADLLMDVFEEINDHYEYALSYKENSKGYKTFKIEEVFELE